MLKDGERFIIDFIQRLLMLNKDIIVRFNDDMVK